MESSGTVKYAFHHGHFLNENQSVFVLPKLLSNLRIEKKIDIHNYCDNALKLRSFATNY